MKKHLISPPFLPIKRHGKYYNYHSQNSFESHQWLIPSLKMYFEGLFNNKKRIKSSDLQAWVQEYQGVDRSKELLITWLGHATMLIQMGGVNILADPIFESPSFFFPRMLPLGISPALLPAIDAVVISHNHFDHMDESTLHFLHKNHNPLFLVPEGNKPWFVKRGMDKVEELTWWETFEFEGIDFTSVPVWHWSQREFFDRNKTLWCGWVIQSKKDTVLFGGDSAYSQHYFTAIGELFPTIDVAIMPIGPCDPDESMRKSHMNAQEAGQAFIDCRARYFIPMHWGTFSFGTDFFKTPVERLISWWQQNQTVLPPHSLCLNKVGQQFHLAYHKNLYLNMHDQNR